MGAFSVSRSGKIALQVSAEVASAWRSANGFADEAKKKRTFRHPFRQSVSNAIKSFATEHDPMTPAFRCAQRKTEGGDKRGEAVIGSMEARTQQKRMRIGTALSAFGFTAGTAGALAAIVGTHGALGPLAVIPAIDAAAAAVNGGFGVAQYKMARKAGAVREEFDAQKASDGLSQETHGFFDRMKNNLGNNSRKKAVIAANIQENEKASGFAAPSFAAPSFAETLITVEAEFKLNKVIKRAQKKADKNSETITLLLDPKRTQDNQVLKLMADDDTFNGLSSLAGETIKQLGKSAEEKINIRVNDKVANASRAEVEKRDPGQRAGWTDADLAGMTSF